MKYFISTIFSLVFVLVMTTQTQAIWNYGSTGVDYTVGSGATIGVTLSANPTSITLPTSQTQLTWTTSGSPDSCTASLESGPSSTSWTGSKSTAASPSPETVTGLSTAGNYVFRIDCVKASTSVSATALVVVNSSAGSPTGTLSATNCTISGSTCSTSVSWTTSNLTANPTEITKNPNGPSPFTPSPLSGGSQNVTVSAGSTTFYLYHNSVLLAQATMLASNPVPSTPSVTLNAAPASIFSGNSSTLSWTSANVTSCTAVASPSSGTWTGSKAINSTYPHESTGSLSATTLFRIVCTGAYGDANSSATVTVLTPGSGITVDLIATPEKINSGDSSTLTWISSGASTCSGIGFDTGGRTNDSTGVVVSPTRNTTYTINCTNGSISGSDQASVTLRKKFLFIEF